MDHEPKLPMEALLASSPRRLDAAALDARWGGVKARAARMASAAPTAESLRSAQRSAKPEPDCGAELDDAIPAISSGAAQTNRVIVPASDDLLTVDNPMGFDRGTQARNRQSNSKASTRRHSASTPELDDSPWAVRYGVAARFT